MKSKILIAALIGITATLSAAAQDSNDMVIQTGNAKNISIASNMHVVLVPADASQTAVSVNKAAAQNLRIQLNGNSFRVEAGDDAPKGTVYLVVADVQNLNIGEKVLVETKGILNAPQINVFADADSKAYLKTRGKVKAESAWETDITVTPIIAASAAPVL